MLVLIAQAAEKESQKKEDIKKQRKLERQSKGKTEVKGKGQEVRDQSSTRKRRAPGHVFFEEEPSTKRARC